MVWDLSRFDKPQTEEERRDGPPELLFVHGGHTSKVLDIAWNHNEKLMMATSAEDNIVQVWQMAYEIYYDQKAGETMQLWLTGLSLTNLIQSFITGHR